MEFNVVYEQVYTSFYHLYLKDIRYNKNLEDVMVKAIEETNKFMCSYYKPDKTESKHMK